MSYLTERLSEVVIANIVRLVPAETGELGYGRDLVCVDDLTKNFEEEDPNTVASIGHQAYRMLTTDRDSIPDAPGRGYNIARLLNRGMTRIELLAQEGLIRAEVVQDDRIDTVTVSCTIVTASRATSVRVELQITPRDPKLYAFTLIIAIAADGTAMLEALK